MKYSTLSGFTFLASLSLANGAIYSTNFDSYSAGRVAGQDDWFLTDTDTAGNPLSFVVELNTTNAAALGGRFAEPNLPTVALQRAYSASLGQSSFSFNFAIIDSNNAFPNRDSFGFSLSNGGANVFSIFFTPSTQTMTPTGSTGQWNLSYAVGAAPAISLTQGVLEGGLYSLNLGFTPNGATTDFGLTVTGSNSEIRSGNLAVNPTSGMSDLAFTYSAKDGIPSQAGNNYIVIDNFQAVPEPSSLLLSIAGLCLGLRRKRR